ncbi:PD-(D/E)XK nuclease family protein [Hoylesella buccalis]|uniref:PD-(D/E)XK endonuclease-like domain-containing protein n=1 Tax=Hoylesella buccalis DNF00853 TaxID=1401074 RepID=A0A096AQL5_9BACT|nr:PD-(D/E)XK nuclease family protein [Hoylesella buccalis]KGF32917.1 hypothetical protein HMPREF2137_12320 [Hoylesella buccalis DNF00853]
MITLQESGIRFDKEQHRYFLGVAELSGITGFLKKRVFPNKYQDIPQWILDRAASNGTLIHESIELLDGGFPPAEMSDELKSYQRIKKENNLTTVANEYIVTDKEHFASGIDLVLTNDKEEIILADIKTTSVLDKEYVSWQLSIYAYLFEMQNPSLKANKLFVIWLRGDKSEYAEVERIDTEIIKDLLQCEVDDRQFVNPLAKTDADVPVAIKDAEYSVYTLVTQLKELNEKKKQLSEGLLKLMQENDVKSYKGQYITLSRKAAYTKKSIDSKKLEEKYPEVYAACIKETNYPEQLQIR